MSDYGRTTAPDAVDWNEQWKRLQRMREHADSPEVWNKKAASFPVKHGSQDGYVGRFLELARILPGESVLDMGCGTAVLAILAAKMKAAKVYGIDIDAIAAISAYDNARLNKVGTRIETCCGDASLLQRNTYDVILANINRNILLQDIPTYSLCLRKDGLLFVSGFYVEDMPMIIGMAQNSGLTYVSHDSIDNWCCIKFSR